MINQAICIDGLVNHLLRPMQHCLTKTPSEITHAIELVDPFNATNLSIILLQLRIVTSYFDVYCPSFADYQNDGIPKIHLTEEEPSCDPSTSK